MDLRLTDGYKNTGGVYEDGIRVKSKGLKGGKTQLRGADNAQSYKNIRAASLRGSEDQKTALTVLTLALHLRLTYATIK